MVINYVRRLVVALVAVCLYAGCERDHVQDFSQYVPTASSNVTRYRGQYTTTLDGATVRDTLCVVDYVKARNSQTGDSIVMHYLRLEDGQPQMRELRIHDIAYLNQEISLRHPAGIDVYYDVAGDEGAYGSYRLSDLHGSVSSGRLAFSATLSGYRLQFEGTNAVHTE